MLAKCKACGEVADAVFVSKFNDKTIDLCWGCYEEHSNNFCSGCLDMYPTWELKIIRIPTGKIPLCKGCYKEYTESKIRW